MGNERASVRGGERRSPTRFADLAKGNGEIETPATETPITTRQHNVAGIQKGYTRPDQRRTGRGRRGRRPSAPALRSSRGGRRGTPA